VDTHFVYLGFLLLPPIGSILTFIGGMSS